MADSDKLNIAIKIIAKQSELIDNFDSWVRLVKANDLVGAAETAKKANLLRTEIFELKKELAKLNKRSGIILMSNSIKHN